MWGGVKLLPMQKRESELYRLIRNRNDVRNKFVYSGIISREQQEKWYAEYLSKENDYMFAVYDAAGNFIGGNALYNINEKAKTGEYGRLLIDKEVGKGNGVKATLAAGKIAKEQLGLKLLYMEVYEDNFPSIITCHKAGFRECRTVKDEWGRTMIYMEMRLE